MDLASLPALCALIALSPGGASSTNPDCAIAQLSGRPDTVASRLRSVDARDAIARVAYAEARNQGDSGLAGVVYTIINRLGSGRWGASVDAVLDSPHQFEPVMRAGGSWRRLPSVTPPEQARIDTIINLALDGRLPDLTNGAQYFQNPRTVASRARAGQVSPRLVNFGGAAPSAVIGAHSFYAETRQRLRVGSERHLAQPEALAQAGGGIFVIQEPPASASPAALGPAVASAQSSVSQDSADPAAGTGLADRAARFSQGAIERNSDLRATRSVAAADASSASPGPAPPADPTRALFVLSNGSLAEDVASAGRSSSSY